MSTLENIIRNSRKLPFPAETIYNAFASQEMLVRWWGPDGFTNTFEVFEFKPGGQWKFMMHGPEGKNYPNESIFVALEEGQKIVIRHNVTPYFTLTVMLTPVAGGTQLTWEQVFDEAPVAQAIKHIVEPANEQNLDRLTAVLQQTV
ncbi:MAG: SRPBCC family protein [Betaproteobacteria bacterium]|nr:SRPBCC family protein [Betaproteobacteria bacterium]